MLANRPDLKAEQLARTRQLMDRAVPDCLVTGHTEILDSLNLPDPDDRHVLAAAICGRAEVIITFNQKHFPRKSLGPFGIEAQHPDQFVSHLITLNRDAVCAALKNQRATLRNPGVTSDQLLDTLERQNLPLSVSQLRPLSELI